MECVTRVCDNGVNERIGSLITKVDRYVCGAVSIVSSEPSFELTLKERVWIMYFCRSILKLNLERIDLYSFYIHFLKVFLVWYGVYFHGVYGIIFEVIY